MKKILIIGSKGMAGHVIYHYLKESANLIVIDIARGAESHVPTYQIDVTNFDALTDILMNEKPDYVINCIGILNKDAEDNPSKSILLNSYLPHFLAKIGTQCGFKLIHISTDCVFSGKDGGYSEQSTKDGIGFYAETKALGEVTYGNNLTIRTSIIGPELKEEGIGLFHWFMNQSGKINGYSNVYWTGITTLELAKLIEVALHQNITGLYHAVNGEKISKFNLLNLFKNIFNNKVQNIIENPDYKVDKSLINTRSDFNYNFKSYEQMLYEMKDWIQSNKNLYKYYNAK